MKQLPSPTTPSTQQRELACQQIDLPGRFPIMTNGQSHDLDKGAKVMTSFLSQESEDIRIEREIIDMVRRTLKATRRKIQEDGRNANDWKYDVMIAVHHKGQVTDFWFGDGPDKEVKIDQNLPEHIRKPIGGQRVKIEKR
jgi:hypothetical protein